MRYLYTIFAIALIFTVATGTYVFRYKERVVASEAGLEINDRFIPEETIEKLYRQPAHRYEDREQFVESLIMKELLIQEAKRTGIDQEEDFRRAIQGFYEQSLTKILLDRKMELFAYAPSENEVARFQELHNDSVVISLLPIPDKSGSVEKIVAPFADLASPLQVTILSLEEGGVSEPISYNGEEYAVRLEELKEDAGKDGGVTAEEARQAIASSRQQQLLGKWLKDLRSGSRVKVSAGAGKEQ